jgi:large subunit ribosomal protein L4
MDDRGNPTRHDGGRAHAYHPSERNYKTELPKQVYAKAIRNALSSQYEAGKLYVIDGAAEFGTGHENAGREFLKEHDLNNRSVAFVVDEFRYNLHDATAFKAAKVDIITKEQLTVQDILRPARLIVELDALKWLAMKYAPLPEIKPIQPSTVDEVESHAAEAQEKWATPVWESSSRYKLTNPAPEPN